LIGREPSEIWRDSLEDGQRRLARSAKVLAATGLLGVFHIAFGLLALLVTTGALATLIPIYPAHVFGFSHRDRCLRLGAEAAAAVVRLLFRTTRRRIRRCSPRYRIAR
jgi:hypothetical protein